MLDKKAKYYVGKWLRNNWAQGLIGKMEAERIFFINVEKVKLDAWLINDDGYFEANTLEEYKPSSEDKHITLKFIFRTDVRDLKYVR